MVSQVEKWAEAAKIGYYSLNIIDPPDGTIWGKFNDRPLKEQQVEDLVDDFKGRLMNSSMKHAMYLAVKHEWIENITEKEVNLVGEPIENLPLIKFTPEALKEIKQRQAMWMMSGNHRHRALEIHVEKMRDKLEAVRERKIKMHSKQREDGFTSTANAIETQADAEIVQREQGIEMTMRWIVLVYDQSAWQCLSYSEGAPVASALSSVILC